MTADIVHVVEMCSCVHSVFCFAVVLLLLSIMRYVFCISSTHKLHYCKLNGIH